jgi:hypothetical protein
MALSDNVRHGPPGTPPGIRVGATGDIQKARNMWLEQMVAIEVETFEARDFGREPRHVPDRRQQISQLYHAALPRHARVRSGLLSEACADDDALQQEVESLLSNESQAAGFLSGPALESRFREPCIPTSR